ncbi:Uncharacterised protein [Mycobacteroides abscessus subsp. abscessus]|nr:Uncharacterised protein [Mycobacteroides abscessus subsp. abscessus]
MPGKIPGDATVFDFLCPVPAEHVGDHRVGTVTLEFEVEQPIPGGGGEMLDARNDRDALDHYAIPQLGRETIHLLSECGEHALGQLM